MTRGSLRSVALCLAATRLTALVIEDTITEQLRVRVWRRYPPASFVGYAFTCSRCMSVWAAATVLAVERCRRSVSGGWSGGKMPFPIEILALSQAVLLIRRIERTIDGLTSSSLVD